MLSAIIDYLFEAAAFMPHGVCLAWRPDLVAFHAFSDGLIAIGYISISLALMWFIRCRENLEYRWLFILFCLAFFACGVTHAFNVLVLWHPYYGLQGIFKFITAIGSIPTAILIWPIIPRALALPRPDALQAANAELSKEIARRTESEAALRRSQEELELRVKERTRELQESEQRFRDFAGAASDWFWEMDHKLRFTLISENYHKITGKPVEPILGHTRRELYRGDFPEERSTWLAHLDVLDRHEPFQNFECHYHGFDGEILALSTSGNPFYDKNGKFLGYRGTGTDITKRKTDERTLIDAKTAAEASTRAKSEFLANMSHELRTPLNSVIGFTEIMASEAFGPIGNERYSEYPALIRGAGIHLLDLINDILDVSKVEAGALDLSEEELSIADVMASSMFMVRERAAAAQLSVSVEVPDDLPDVRADETRLKQIFLNLLSNAIKFTPSGGSVNVEASLSDSGGLNISVEDTGIGIDAGNLPHIFEPFWQSEEAFSRTQEGTGLGLSLVKSLVELHGGSIGVESRFRHGTRFTISLPPTRVVKDE